MEWIKKNWMGLTVVVLAIIVIIYWYNSQKTDTSKKIYVTKQARRTAERKEGEKSVQVLEKALNRCGQEYANVRLAVTAETHPCFQINKQVELERQAISKKGAPVKKS